jgi:hypothetical protein
MTIEWADSTGGLAAPHTVAHMPDSEHGRHAMTFRGLVLPAVGG